MATVMQSSLPAGGFVLSESPEPSPSYLDLISLERGLYDTTLDPKRNYVHAEYENKYASSTAPSSPSYSQSMRSRDSYFSTPSTYSSLDPNEDYDGEDAFPSFGNSSPCTPTNETPFIRQHESDSTDTQATNTPPSEDLSIAGTATDDQAIEHEPTRQVDYLAHEWKEQDIWSSWRYVVARRKTLTNSVRLENASWRTWTKAKYNLKTISPESLNWLKDCDVTWLYGPLQVDISKSMSRDRSPPPSRLSTSSSCVWKKSNLKKKSASAAILERSRSQHSLLQRAGEIIRIQQSSPKPGRTALRREYSLPSYNRSSTAPTPAEVDLISSHASQSTLGTQTPSESKHVFFNEEVRQVRAIESEDEDGHKNEPVEDSSDDETDEDDDGGLMMAPQRTRSNRSTPRGSFSDVNKTIQPLPSTTLKYRKDTPEPRDTTPAPSNSWFPQRTLNHSTSQETLRPSRPTHNFLLDDDPELNDDPWPSTSTSFAGQSYTSPYANEDEPGSSSNMRRTPSGMFMPYDESGDEAAMNNTILGQAMYAVNTFRDIAHVVWNVGWTRK